MIKARDALLLGSEGEVCTDVDLRLSIGCHVDGVSVRRDVDESAEVILHSGQIVDVACRGKGAAVARVDLAGRVEAPGNSQTGESSLWSQRQADIRVVERSGRCSIPLSSEGSILRRNRAVNPV